MPELLKRAAALDKTIRPMAYLEPNKGGIVSLGLSRLAAALKVEPNMQLQTYGDRETVVLHGTYCTFREISCIAWHSRLDSCHAQDTVYAQLCLNHHDLWTSSRNSLGLLSAADSGDCHWRGQEATSDCR